MSLKTSVDVHKGVWVYAQMYAPTMAPTLSMSVGNVAPLAFGSDMAICVGTHDCRSYSESRDFRSENTESLADT
jgi:hypothetical protein